MSKEKEHKLSSDNLLNIVLNTDIIKYGYKNNFIWKQLSFYSVCGIYRWNISQYCKIFCEYLFYESNCGDKIYLVVCIPLL